VSSILLYSADFCGDCRALRAWMDREGIVYELRDIRKHPEYAAELAEKTGKEGVPYLVIDGAWVRGYDLGKPFSETFARALFNR